MNNLFTTSQISIIEKGNINKVYDDIRTVYLSNSLPWVIGYSGGKDSTASLQLIWYALQDLPPENLSKPIYVISTDTLVETPIIVDHVNQNLASIAKAAKEQGLPIEVSRLTPEINDTFWVNLIGRGYPAPHTRFRWCTERMKIRPADKFILSKAAKYGEVVLILGQRRDESTVRAHVMEGYKITGSRLSRHSTLPKAYVYTPIEDFTTDDVWTYLLQKPSPWGGNNRNLASLYQSAQSGECPLVVDLSTPSCGNSRFGCWVCTVVTRDKSMEAMIDNGEEWMIPMLEFRDYLAATQDPERKKEIRHYRRRDGAVKVRRKEGTLIRGPYLLSFRKELLNKLLKVQKQVREEGTIPDLELISPEELYEIRRIWRKEEYDWEDSVPAIWKDAVGTELPWPNDDTVRFGHEEQAILSQICAEEQMPLELVMALLESQRQRAGIRSRTSIHAEIENTFRRDWRKEEEVLNAVEVYREQRTIT